MMIDFFHDIFEVDFKGIYRLVLLDILFQWLDDDFDHKFGDE